MNFDKNTHSGNEHANQCIDHFHHLRKFSHTPFWEIHSPQSRGNYCSDFCHCRFVLPPLEFHINICSSLSQVLS